MDKVLIIGGRGTALVIAEQILNAKEMYNMSVGVEGFAIDDQSYGGYINSIPIVCGTREAKDYAKGKGDIKIIYSLYRPDLMEDRINLFNSYNIPEELMYTFIHPSAVISKSAIVGVGSVVLAQTVVNPNAVIGKYCTINSGCLVGHDSKIDAYNYIAGHVCIGSNLNIGIGNFIGLNSSIRNFISIGNYNIIGMASNVVKSIENSKVLMGNPAKEVEKVNNAIR